MKKRVKKNPTISRRTAIIFLLINVLCWGAALPIAKPAVEIISPFQFLFLRYVFAAVLSLPILFYFLPKITNLGQTILTVIGLELIGTTLALGLLYEGLARTSALEASLLVTTTPVFTTLAGIWFLKEKQEGHEWIGLVLALLGAFILAFELVFTGKAFTATFSLTGNLLILFQNIATAAYFILAKKYYKNIPKFFATTISFYVGAISFFLLNLTTHNSQLTTAFPPVSQLASWPVLLPVVYMAIFGSIIGLTAYIKGQDGIEASEASLFTYLQPLVYIPISLVFLQETITWPMVLAMVLVGIGVFWAEKRT